MEEFMEKNIQNNFDDNKSLNMIIKYKIMESDEKQDNVDDITDLNITKRNETIEKDNNQFSCGKCDNFFKSYLGFNNH